jgi:hypothetical protein
MTQYSWLLSQTSLLFPFAPSSTLQFEVRWYTEKLIAKEKIQNADHAI